MFALMIIYACWNSLQMFMCKLLKHFIKMDMMSNILFQTVFRFWNIIVTWKRLMFWRWGRYWYKYRRDFRNGLFVGRIDDQLTDQRGKSLDVSIMRQQHDSNFCNISVMNIVFHWWDWSSIKWGLDFKQNNLMYWWIWKKLWKEWHYKNEMIE